MPLRRFHELTFLLRTVRSGLHRVLPHFGVFRDVASNAIRSVTLL
jgi:hypothetical protein